MCMETFTVACAGRFPGPYQQDRYGWAALFQQVAGGSTLPADVDTQVRRLRTSTKNADVKVSIHITVMCQNIKISLTSHHELNKLVHRSLYTCIYMEHGWYTDGTWMVRRWYAGGTRLVRGYQKRQSFFDI